MKEKFIEHVIETPNGKAIIVDFSPKKVCNFNCIYCPAGQTTEMINERRNFYPVENIVKEIKDYIKNEGTPFLTILTGGGEPTLYSRIGELAKKVRELGTKTKTKILTNGSLLMDEDVLKNYRNFILYN